LLEIKDLSVTFSVAHSVQAVQGVSLKVEKRKKVAIIGETGSGKSVLLLAVLRLLPTTAEVKGTVLYNGANLLEIDEKDMQIVRGAQLAYVPQGSGSSMNPLMTVGFQVGEPLMQHREFTKKQAVEKSIGLLEKFHIGNEKQRVKDYPHTFSGGMKQRALVAMGISAGAQYIFADEPTKGLDENKVKQLKETFLALEDQAILCVTHDLGFAKDISEYIHVMYASQQFESAPTDEVFREPLHPYMQDMINALPENGLKVVGGFAPSHSEALSGCRYRPRCRDCSARCEIDPPMTEVYPGHKVRCWKYAHVN